MGFVFTTGSIGVTAPARVAAAWSGVPVLVAGGSGVVSDHPDPEGTATATGVLASGGSAVPFVARASSPDELPAALAAALDRATGGKTSSVVLFVKPHLWQPETLASLATSHPHVSIVGGGTSAEAPAIVDHEGVVHEGAVAGMVVRGLAPRIGVSPGGRILGTGFLTVTEARGALVMSLDGQPALDVLTASAASIQGKPLVLALLPGPEGSGEAASDNPLRTGRLRAIRGVDPARKAVLIGETVATGDRLAFVAVEGPAARADLDRMARELGQTTRGAAARFGLFVSCAGRGPSLYGSTDAEGRLLRARFDGLPFAGVHSSFEMAPVPRPTLHYYTGIFGLFTVPS